VRGARLNSPAVRGTLLDTTTPELAKRRRATLAEISEVPKVLNSSEDAHIKSMSTFETDEHLRRWHTLSRPPAVSVSQCERSRCAKRGSGVLHHLGALGLPER
jgi:hypothetical protein